MKPTVGIVGTGIYLPKDRTSSKDTAEKTKCIWTEKAIE